MQWRVAMTTVGMITLSSMAGCSSSSNKAPAPSAEAKNAVPTSTHRVYLATALACSNLNSDSARFTPLKVSGSGYSTTIKPVEDCKELAIFTSYVYDVPMLAAGEVRITPGNQPATTLDAAKVASGGAATVFYARVGEGKYKVTVTNYNKDAQVAGAK